MQRCEKCGLILSYPHALSEESSSECNYCTNFKRKDFLGREALLERLGKEGAIGVSVSGGKDSLFVWYWMVEQLGADRVIAFNHHKVGAVHQLAIEPPILR